ncbi:JAB domain-containing protein [Leeuwenhoekiella aequorea]|uniref:JAB domain-containing protein n=1 Tax=Leeuwenhoekiella TaxID=283735 RepID=UPI00048F5AF1|nr:JAB domain-containing protein [Leeuwenhoekiella sp. MAR_2009_132]|tara:strand:- start:637 stop:1086 length:450 start_codon:yes stop_codon:yes gene_type:complete
MESRINEIKISYVHRVKALNWPKVSSSRTAAEVLFKNWDIDTITVYESFKILLLNNSNQIKGIYQISQGGITGTLVDMRLLFAVALKSLSIGLILAHNHPSGALKPSQADINITRKIKTAAEFFDLKILDHLILNPDGEYYSFADEGIL